MKDRIKQLVAIAWDILDDKGSFGEIVLNAREFIELVQYLTVEAAAPPPGEVDLESDKVVIQSGNIAIKPDDILEILQNLKTTASLEEGIDMSKVDEWRKVIHAIHDIEESPERVPATEEFFHFCEDVVRDGWEKAAVKADLAKKQEIEELEKLKRLEKQNELDYFYDWELKWGNEIKPAHTALLAVNSWFIDHHGTDHPVARYIREKITEAILK